MTEHDDDRYVEVPLEDLDRDALLLAADDAMAAGDGDGAEQVLRHAEGRFPGDVDVQLGLADALLMQDKPEAEAQVRRSAGLLDDDPERLLRAANQMYSIDDLQWATQYVKRVWEQAPRDFPQAALLAYLTGRLAWVSGLPQAEKLLEDAFDCEPERADFGLTLAEYHIVHDDPERAIEVIDEALGHSPDDDGLLSLRAELLDN